MVAAVENFNFPDKQLDISKITELCLNLRSGPSNV